MGKKFVDSYSENSWKHVVSSIIDGLTCQSQGESNAIAINEIGESCEDEKTLNECCISCKIGLMTSSEKCSQLVNFLPSKEAQSSFMECCSGEEDPRQTRIL